MTIRPTRDQFQEAFKEVLQAMQITNAQSQATGTISRAAHNRLHEALDDLYAMTQDGWVDPCPEYTDQELDADAPDYLH